MEKAVKLNEAFDSFTQASKSLETYYAKLSQKVQYLTHELEKKNGQLNEAILEAGESKDYFQAVFQSIGEAIIVLDQDEKITMINRAAETLFETSTENIKGTMFNDMDFSVDVNSSGTRLAVKGKKYDIILSRSTVSGPEGSVRGYVILIKDVTRIKELEHQNERNQRLISMGEMAAKIVHEIRSPLCSIELFSNMLSNDLRETAHSEMANGISTGIKSLNNILTNMLLFAKPQKMSFNDVKLREIVGEILKILAPLVETRGIGVVNNITDDIVTGDSELLKQVFMNIVLNAIQAMPDGGVLKVEMDQKGEFTVVNFTDEGEGIDPGNVEKIFDPFFSTKDKGTGLGLAIAHKIMQSHNGFINAFKNEGKGSTFSVYLPRKESILESEPGELLCAETGK
jgi:nitrogen fixation/metabolism regulation signal transduction histidine kinase